MLSNLTNLISVKDLYFLNKITKSINDRSPSTDGIAEKLDQLMPSIYIIVATLGAFLVLLIVLTKLLYNPVKKMVKNRQDFIQKNIDDSINAKQKALSFEQEARNKLNASKLIASEIINKSKVEAEILKNQYINQGKIKADKLVNRAKDDIKNKKINLEKNIQKEIINVAIEISEKIISKKVSKEDVEKY